MTREKFINTKPIIDILQEQLDLGTSSVSQYKKLQEEISNARQTEIDPNFKGTLQELHAYCRIGKEKSNIDDYIKLNDLNLKRWIEELQLLMIGSEAVTIDYEQRKGREI